MAADLRVETRSIREVMTPRPVTVRPETTLGALKELFAAHDFNGFPVVDAHGTLRGMVTKLDLLAAFRPDRRRLVPDLRSVWAERVGDLMSRGLVTIEADAPVVAAIDLMVELRARSLPVVDRVGGSPALVGVVSRGDVLQCLVVESGSG